MTRPPDGGKVTSERLYLQPLMPSNFSSCVRFAPLFFYGQHPICSQENLQSLPKSSHSVQKVIPTLHHPPCCHFTRKAVPMGQNRYLQAKTRAFHEMSSKGMILISCCDVRRCVHIPTWRTHCTFLFNVLQCNTLYRHPEASHETHATSIHTSKLSYLLRFTLDSSRVTVRR